MSEAFSNTTTLITGGTGTGKSTLLRTAAIHLWKNYQKRLRLYTADGGGLPTALEAAIQLGVIEVWRLRSRVGAGGEGLVEETLARASAGYWPEEITPDGFCAPGAKLIAPMQVVFIMKCPQGHVVRSGARRDNSLVLCPSCKMTVDSKNAIWAVEQKRALPEDVGGVAFEGLSSWQDWFLQAFATRRGSGEITVGERSGSASIQSGEYQLGGNNKADMWAAQTEAQKWLLNSTAIPGLVMPAIWTGMEQKVGDFGEQLGQWAPSIAGFAKCAEVPQWVGNWIGLDMQPGPQGVPQRRLYLSEYRGPDAAPHRYKVRSEGLPAYLEDPPCPKCQARMPCDLGAPHFERLNLGVLFGLLDEARARAMDRGRLEIPNAPGPRVATLQAHPPLAVAAATPAAVLGQAAAVPPAAPMAVGAARPRPIVVAPRPMAKPIPKT